MYLCQCYALNSSHPFLPSLYPQSILYVCISILPLQIDPSVSFSRFHMYVLIYDICFSLSVSQGVLTSATIDIWGQVILCSGSCSRQCRMLSSSPGFYLLDARGTLPPLWLHPFPVITTEMSQLPNIPGEAEWPWLNNAALIWYSTALVWYHLTDILKSTGYMPVPPWASLCKFAMRGIRKRVHV